MQAPVELIVGLGNPGPNYERTRHNAGADLVLELAKSLHVELKHESKFFGDTARVTLDGHDVRLLIPSTFMNLSGKSVNGLAKFYQIAPENILVVHDDSTYHLAFHDSKKVEAMAVTMAYETRLSAWATTKISRVCALVSVIPAMPSK